MTLDKNEGKPSTSRPRKNIPASPKLMKRDPYLPASLPTTSRNLSRQIAGNEPQGPFRKRCCKYLYDKEKKTYCGRTCRSWCQILSYTFMYLVFLATYTLIFLYATLSIIKATTDFQDIDKSELLTYSEQGIGLTATPASENGHPLISYRKGQADTYSKYVNAIDRLVSHRRKREVNNLGACGQHPYGYSDNPCVIIRINKQFKWAGKPLELNSTEANAAPIEVQNWLREDKTKLWLLCNGYHSYDKEHVGTIRYFPYPPGIDAQLFPMDMDNASPLFAIQLSNFTLGVSLVIECKLWYEKGPSTVQFMVFVDPGQSSVSNKTNGVDNL